MATLTGREGKVKFQNDVVAKITNVSLNLNRVTIDDTCIGGDARTFVKGLFNATGNGTCIVDSSDTYANAMLNEVFIADGNKQIDIQLNKNATESQAFGFAAIITSVSPSVETGNKTVATFSFQVTGEVSGRF